MDCLVCHAAKQNVQHAMLLQGTVRTVAPRTARLSCTPATTACCSTGRTRRICFALPGTCARAAGRTPGNAGAGVRVVHLLLAAKLRARVPPVSLHNMAPHVPAPMDPQQTEEMNLRVMTRIDPATEEVCCADVIPAPVFCSHAIRTAQPIQLESATHTIGTSATKSQCCHRCPCYNVPLCPVVIPMCLQILAAVGHVALYEFNTSGQTWVRGCRANRRRATLLLIDCRHVCCCMHSPDCGLCRPARMSKAPCSFSGGGPRLCISSRS
jgi:hypothetical protein